MKWRPILVLAAGVIGCGGPDVSKFEGTWNYQSGAGMTITCSGQTTSEVLTGGETLAAGTDYDLLVTGTCTVGLNVDGDTASATAGETCNLSGTDSNGNPYTEMLNISSWSFSVSGNTATESISGSLVYTSGGSTVNCSFIAGGNLTKAAS